VLGTTPQGRQNFSGVEFDVRGLVEVGAEWHLKAYPELPARVSGIGVRQRARKLHFLHAAVGKESDGTAVGSYIIHRGDGSTTDVPLVYGRDLIDWATAPPKDGTSLRVAWQGPHAPGIDARLYLTMWENPQPEVPIESLDLVSHRTQAAVVLIAITAEP
jgi:hypothetical protein